MDSDSPFARLASPAPATPTDLTLVGIYFCEQNSCFHLWKSPTSERCPRCHSDQAFRRIHEFRTTYVRV